MKKFDQKLDFLRVLSMCLVIVIHVSNYYCRAFSNISNTSFLIALIFSALSKAAVPIFMMISGALLLSKPYEENKHKKRITRLLTTLILFTIVYFFWDKYYLGLEVENIFSLFFKPRREMLWFLYAIICLYIALPYIKLMTDNMDEKMEIKFIKQWLFFSGFVYACKFFIGVDPKYLVPIISGTYYLGYFMIGYFIVKHKEDIDYKKYNIYYILSIILCASILISLTYFHSISTNSYIEKYLTYKNLFMNVISISSFLLIYSNIEDRKYKLVHFLSPYSFGVYLVHGMIMNVVMRHNHYQSLSPLFMIPLSSLLIFSIALPIVWGLKKVPILKDYL
ncbi:MAG: acyltransferase family protein [Firmicutes bacterium]|nr:acyltransferase family protein [Bacillota bacterium]